MNLVNILTRRDPLKRAFVTLEDGMTDILNEEFMLPSEPEPGALAEGGADLYDADLDRDFVDEAPPIASEDPAERVTAHTQNRLAGHAAFEEARIKASQDLSRIGEALGNILASQSMSREFFNDCYADIHRANELEIGNTALMSDNRRLNERVEKLEKLRARYDQLIDVLKRRENKLLQDTEQLRETLGALRLEVVEARNHIARSDSMQGELQASLAAKTAESERFMRDAELLREKNVSLALDLDLAQKKQTETRRKYEDLSAAHASDAARLADISGRLAGEETETDRLQKLADTLEAKLVEASENSAHLSGELNEREKRYQSENHALKMEIQSLGGRLHATTSEQRDATVELNDLRSRLSDVESEKLILERKFAALGSEIEAERRLYIAQTDLMVPLDTAPAELPRKQADKMRAEMVMVPETDNQTRQARPVDIEQKPRSRPIADVTDRTVTNGKFVSDFERPAPIARRA